MIWLYFYQFWVNFTHFQSYFEALNGEKVASARIHDKKKAMSQEQQKIAILWFDYAFINFGSISPIFGQIFQCSMVTKWHQLEFVAGNGNESGTAKRCYLCDLIMLLSILGQFYPFFGQIFKCSMVTKSHQPESIAGNGNELATGKKMPCLRSDYAIINFGSISPIFDQILKCSMMTKVASAGIYLRYANESGTAKKNRNYTRVPSSPSCQLD